MWSKWDKQWNKIDFLKSYSQKSLPQVNNVYENIILPVLTQEQKQDCEKGIPKKSARCT